MRAKEIIREGLIKSAEREDFRRIMNKQFGTDDRTGFTYVIAPDDWAMVFRADGHEMAKFHDTLMKMLDSLGWFISAKGVNGQKVKTLTGLAKDDDVRLFLEPKYDEPYKAPKVLYHVTKKENVDKILKQGLAPKTRNKIATHPERVYLATSDLVAMQFFQDLTRKHWITGKTLQGGKHALLQIDATQLQNKFYVDSKFVNRHFEDEPAAIYTTTNIPPSAIKLSKILYPTPIPNAKQREALRMQQAKAQLADNN